MSIRSSLLKLLAVLPRLGRAVVGDPANLDKYCATRPTRTQRRSSQAPNGFFDLPCQGLVVVADQAQGASKGDADGARARHLPGEMEHPVEPLDPDGHDRNGQ